MRTIIFIFLTVILFTANSGCAASQAATADLADTPSSSPLTAEEEARLNAQRTAFLQAPELNERLRRLLELEQQALQLAIDEPLKLGSIGSAILDIYPGSQTGHFAMGRFYSHVESSDAQASHDQELARLQTHMQQSGDGSRASPLQVLTIYDAHAYAQSSGTSPVGSIYQSNEFVDFGFMLVARPDKGPLEQTYFDISHVLEDFADHATRTTDHQAPAEEAAGTNPWTFMRLLAARKDTAAQAAIGRYLASVQKYDDAISWLTISARSGNVLANALLARLYWTQSEATEDETDRDELRERSLENHMHAIALGSTDSMYTLANLYLNNYFGEENKAAAIPLLTQAGNLNHAESLLYLGHLHSAGHEVEQSTALAKDYFTRAAALNNSQAIVSYGRFLSGLEAENLAADESDSQIHTRLEEVAAKDNAEAMVVLGNLHARGLGTRASTRRAFNWYKKAVNLSPVDADIVNEVAWTLTVSDIAGLRRGKFAKRIMDTLMEENPEMRTRPEYLDTWAAAHAASGDFDQAIVLQEQAIAAATSQQREDVLDILKDHLQQFRAGAAITEKAP